MQTQCYCYGCSINMTDSPVVNVYVTDYPVVKVQVDELSSARIGSINCLRHCPQT